MTYARATPPPVVLIPVFLEPATVVSVPAAPTTTTDPDPDTSDSETGADTGGRLVSGAEAERARSRLRAMARIVIDLIAERQTDTVCRAAVLAAWLDLYPQHHRIQRNAAGTDNKGTVAMGRVRQTLRHLEKVGIITRDHADNTVTVLDRAALHHVTT